MTNSDLMTAAALIAGISAAVFSLLAWLTARQRQPFTLKRDGDLVLLTRARRPAVQVRRVFVFGHSQLVTADAACTTEWRMLQRDTQLVISLGSQGAGDGVAFVHPSETVTVEYRRLWPWDSEAPHRLPLFRRNHISENKNKRQAKREKLDTKATKWTQWNSALL